MSIVDTKPIVLVVGPHRSGTSFLTQVVSVLGFDLGKTLMLPSFDNPRGFWENQKIVDIHDGLISSFGKDWTTLASLEADWLNDARAQEALNNLLHALETDFRPDEAWLIKDPRLCVLYPMWEKIGEAVDRPLKLITILRSPQASSQSIKVRNRLTAEDADIIALSYIQAMTQNLKGAIGDSFVYENLVKLTGAEIIDLIQKVLGMDSIPRDGNLETQIERLTIDTSDKDIENTHIHQVYVDQVGSSPVITSQILADLVKSLMDDAAVAVQAEISNHATLLDPSQQLVSVTQAELDSYKQAGLENEALRKHVDEKVEEIRALKEVEETVASLQDELGRVSGGIVERDNLIKNSKLEISELRNLFDVKMLDAMGERRKLQDQQAELEKSLEDAERQLASKKKALESAKLKLTDNEKALSDAINEYEIEKKNHVSSRTKFRATEKKMKAKTTRAEKKVIEKSSEVSALKLEVEQLSHSLGSSEANFEKVTGDLNSVLATLGAEQAQRKEVEVQMTELMRLKEMQDTTIELDAARSKMVESMLNTRVGELEERVKYYEKAPLKAGMKKMAFSTLRSLRRVLPLPEKAKLNIAQKMTGVAQSLQPPQQFSLLPEPVNVEASTQLDFAFKETENPVISIVVPVYNEISQTIACLKSIYQQAVSVDYEVILADDKSPDPFHSILKEVPGLRYFRNEENLHFLRNCNQNAAHARGDYIVFLNNDTIVKPGWLQTLLNTFLENGNVGIVGSKLIYPSGELQEAGGILWEDASGWNWGKGQDANHPLYNFLRDVDYVSGASLMIPTVLWREVGGFNEGLEKAYYEDADLCFRIRSMGYRILYQPESEVIHIEGLSSGTDLTQGAKQYQIVNQTIFKETWASVLTRHLPNATTPLLASDRMVKGHVLYIDATTPEPDKDAGSVNAAYSMRLLIEAGYRVHFIPGSNFAYWGEYTKDLQRFGVECVYHPFYSNLQSYLDDRGDMFQHIIVSRAESAESMLPTLKKNCPNAKIIYNTVDLHFMRMEREAKILKDESIKLAAKDMRKKELGFIKQSDATIVLSEVERSLLSKQKTIKDKLWTIPLIRPDAHRLVEFSTTGDIVFIGGYNHPPNVDAAEWLVNDIWPEMRKRLPGVKLHVCGSSMPDYFKDWATDDILIKGFIPDLDELLSKTRLTIAPLRYGAGLKGKVASSIGAGVPCIGTDVAFEGMAEEGLSEVKFLAKTPKTFAEIAESLYFDEEKWTQASLSGVEYHNANYAYRNVSQVYQQMLDSLI